MAQRNGKAQTTENAQLGTGPGQHQQLKFDSCPVDVNAEEKKVGYRNPPKKYQWGKGQSGNKNGRPKGRPNKKLSIEKIVNRKVKDVGTPDPNMSLFEANILAHGVKGAKGDVRSSRHFIETAEKYGGLGSEEANPLSDKSGGLPALASKSDPAEALFENLDQTLLSREEMIEMSRLAQIIELGGDFTALSVADFTQLKMIIEKGRGKDVTPSA
jgi:Family of unknown function (DUF5681)